MRQVHVLPNEKLLADRFCFQDSKLAREKEVKRCVRMVEIAMNVSELS